MKKKDCTGSALIALIAAILIFSVLAAALLPMVSSSTEEAVLSNLGDKAYLLAEGGYRLVKNRYDNAQTQTRNAALEALDDGNFTLSGSQGTIRLGIYSYFFPIPAGSYPSSPITIISNPPGRIALNNDSDDDNVTLQSGLWLNIRGKAYQIATSMPASSDDNVTITINDTLGTVPADTNAYPQTWMSQPPSAANGVWNFPYNPNEGSMFPLRNGRISVQGYATPLSYRYNNRMQHQFEDVRDPSNPDAAFSLPANAAVILNPAIRVRSTGIVGGGALETRRKVNYYIAGESEKIEDVSVGLNDFQTTGGSPTSVQITAMGSNDALAISNADNQAALVQLSGAVTEAPLARAHRRGGGYLSYDAQAKVGFYSGTAPLTDAPNGIIRSSILPVAAGTSFRLNNISSDTAYNGYGLSFVRANNTSAPADIFANIVPPGLNGQPLLVLWQQTCEGGSRTWVAYKRLQNTIYQEDFDAGISGWTRLPDLSSNLWHGVAAGGRVSEAFPTGSPALNFGDPGGLSILESGGIISPAIQLCSDTPKITLTFWSRDDGNTTTREVRVIGPQTVVSQTVSQNSSWTQIAMDISSFAGQEIQLRFQRSNSIGPYTGWYIDDIQIHCQWPVQNSTLLVRLREAAVVRFSQGGPEPILQGDWVYGELSGTRARVLLPPVVTDDCWDTNAGAGTLLLDRLSANPEGFQTGERLFVTGRAGGITAHVDAFDNTLDRKANVIKVFYARATGADSGDTDPLDATAHTYPRLGVNDPFQWPPYEDDNWTADQDYFRLVQWDDINSLVGLGYIDGSNGTIIRSYDSDLQSPPLGQPIGTELGLHAYGAGADNTYFDDFGLRLFFGTSYLFESVLQQ